MYVILPILQKKHLTWKVRDMFFTYPFYRYISIYYFLNMPVLEITKF